MGTVFAGMNPAGTRVAIKRMHVEHAQDSDFRARFHREVQVLQCRSCSASRATASSRSWKPTPPQTSRGSQPLT